MSFSSELPVVSPRTPAMLRIYTASSDNDSDVLSSGFSSDGNASGGENINISTRQSLSPRANTARLLPSSHGISTVPLVHSPLAMSSDVLGMTRSHSKSLRDDAAPSQPSVSLNWFRQPWFGIPRLFGRGEASISSSVAVTQVPGGTWWTLVLDNKGSVARDHLANERTFLAWLRTSLSLITVGVGVAQLFRLSAPAKTAAAATAATSEREYGKTLGGTLVALGIMFLLLGVLRFFESQRFMTKGKYPASRGLVALSSASVGAVMVALLAIVLIST